MNAPVAKLPGCFVPESKEHPTTFLTLTAVSGPWQGAGTALETRGLRAGATLHEHAGPEGQHAVDGSVGSGRLERSRK
jgi:hypothetical protein